MTAASISADSLELLEIRDLERTIGGGSGSEVLGLLLGFGGFIRSRLEDECISTGRIALFVVDRMLCS